MTDVVTSVHLSAIYENQNGGIELEHAFVHAPNVA